ncbi:MAG TPA: LacI family DNA-binding transcriptional regulator [Pseudonocardia sp.]|nr:LacI family DNA-binding transcriptional regulator [Pseudonocardia sp.]
MKEAKLSTSGAPRATLATIAASAGVSVATVSKVLNGRADVAPTTRARVADLLAKHDYVGRRGGARAQPVVELVFDDELNGYATEIVQGALDAARGLGAVVSVAVRGRRGAVGPPVAWARELITTGREAVIGVVNSLTAGHVTALARAGLPLVVIDPIDLPRARVTSVGATNFAGGVAAARHLLSLGHRRVAYVGGSPTAACSQARMHGFRAALESAGLPLPDGYLRDGLFRYQDGVDGASALFALPAPPTAVFAACDEVAAGVVEAARAHGLRVPEDLSVVGFDDTELARYGSPPLTTVRQPLREMGAVALRTALRMAAGEELDSHHVELATELVVRKSTAPPAD